MGRTEDGGGDILKIERSLGFWWPRGISRQGGRRNVPAVKALLDKIGPLTSHYSTTLPVNIRSSQGLRVHINKIFDDLGQALWPDHQVDRSTWLVKDANVQNLGGLYPRNLYFSDPKGQAKLRDLFSQLIVRKCVARYWNARDLAFRRSARESSCQPLEDVTDSSLEPVTSDSDGNWVPHGRSVTNRRSRRLRPTSTRRRARSSTILSTTQTPESAQDLHEQRAASISKVFSGNVSKLGDNSAGQERTRISSDERSIDPVGTPLVVVMPLAPRNLLDMAAEGTLNYRAPRPGQSERTDQRRLAGSNDMLQTITTPSAIMPDKEKCPETHVNSSLCNDRDAPQPLPKAALAPFAGNSDKNATRTSDHVEACLRSGEPDHGECSIRLAHFDACALGPSLQRSETRFPLYQSWSSSQPVGCVSSHRNQLLPPVTSRPETQPGLPIEEGSERRAEAEQTSCHPKPKNRFEDVQVEIDWNRDTLELGHMILEDCETVSAFFKLLEDHLPPELVAHQSKIKQVKVKVIDASINAPRLYCRIPRSPLGRASMRQMFRKLRSYPNGGFLGLKFRVDWTS